MSSWESLGEELWLVDDDPLVEFSVVEDVWAADPTCPVEVVLLWASVLLEW